VESVESNHVRLADRLALRPKEAAEALGISERHLRTLLPDVPHLYLGNRLVIPVKPFEEWLREQAEAEKSRSDRVAEAIIADIRGDRK
jgi:hypothetical protein